MLKLAAESEKKLVHVSIDPEGAKVGDITGLSFWALVDFVPRIGETIRTQNKKFCKVVAVFHGVVSDTPAGQTQAFIMVPTVYATMSKAEEERE